MRYAVARAQRAAKEEAYRAYVAECMRMISVNTAKYAGGSYMSAGYMEILHPRPLDTRTADEVVRHIKQRLSQP